SFSISSAARLSKQPRLRRVVSGDPAIGHYGAMHCRHSGLAGRTRAASHASAALLYPEKSRATGRLWILHDWSPIKPRAVADGAYRRPAFSNTIARASGRRTAAKTA